MNDKKLPTDPYKGVRDFYPEDMAIQRYIFQTWSKTAESFGFERYDASIFEPSDLYKAKGAESEEIVGEQTYTFTDRGEREVTLRPEITPTIARMIAKKRRELSFPIRWYSIPNLYRYERPQRGRLREFWQLNCDLFGGDRTTGDIEVITLAHQILLDFGAAPEMFEILINDRQEMSELFAGIGIADEDTITKITRLNDRKNKISNEEYRSELTTILEDEEITEKVIAIVEDQSGTNKVIEGLRELNITNVRIDRTIARGFNYYTGTVFEIFDTSKENNRAMIGGGRFDNLTALFGGDPVSGIGFGMGDVTMRDFLETHNLIPEYIRSTAPQVVVIPIETEQNLFAEGVATKIRHAGHKVSTDIGTKNFSKKITSASDKGSKFVVVIGENEMKSETFTVKNLLTGQEKKGKLGELMNTFSDS